MSKSASVGCGPRSWLSAAHCAGTHSLHTCCLRTDIFSECKTCRTTFMLREILCCHPFKIRSYEGGHLHHMLTVSTGQSGPLYFVTDVKYVSCVASQMHVDVGVVISVCKPPPKYSSNRRVSVEQQKEHTYVLNTPTFSLQLCECLLFQGNGHYPPLRLILNTA